MEINLVADGEPNEWRRQGTYVVTVGGRFKITATVTEEGDTVKEWINHINKMYRKRGGSRKRELVVGLGGDRAMYYGGYSHYFDRDKGKKDEDVSFDVLQLCVGSHCLLFFKPERVNALREFFWDPTTTFVGVGIEKTAKKIERFIEGFAIRNQVELAELAVQRGYLNQDNPSADSSGEVGGGSSNDSGRGGGNGGAEGRRRGVKRHDLSELAKAVLGEEMNFVKPKRGIKFGETEFKKYATVEAFLAFQVGAKLLNNSHLV